MMLNLYFESKDGPKCDSRSVFICDEITVNKTTSVVTVSEENGHFVSDALDNIATEIPSKDN